VRPVSKEEALGITEVRGVLEGLWAARAATAATPRERQELRQLGYEMQQAVRRGDVIGHGRSGMELHTHIREASRLRTASDVLNRLRYHSVRYQFSVTLLPGRPRWGSRSTSRSSRPSWRGSRDWADTLMREHLLSLADAIKHVPEGIPAMPPGLSAA
jgi:DNA-binding GntR family transcriptional regulator